MKKIKIELDVDFIGGLGPLTEEEKAAISDYLKAHRNRSSKYKAIPRRTGKSNLQKGKKQLV